MHKHQRRYIHRQADSMKRIEEHVEYLKSVGYDIFLVIVIIVVTLSWVYHRRGTMADSVRASRNIGVNFVNYTRLETQDPGELIDKAPGTQVPIRETWM